MSQNDWADVGPQLDGRRVVWMAREAGTDYEIGFYDPSVSPAVKYLTSNTVQDSAPSISGVRVVWASNGEIEMWDGATRQVTSLTSNAWPDYAPDVSPQRVVWSAATPFGVDLFTRSFAGDFRIRTFGDDKDRVQSADRWQLGRVVHRGEHPQLRPVGLGLGEQRTPVQLTDNENGENPATGFDLDDPYITFSVTEGADREIRVWDKSSRSVSTVTSNSTQDALPQVSGARIAWDSNYGPAYHPTSTPPPS